MAFRCLVAIVFGAFMASASRPQKHPVMEVSALANVSVYVSNDQDELSDSQGAWKDPKKCEQCCMQPTLQNQGQAARNPSMILNCLAKPGVDSASGGSCSKNPSHKCRDTRGPCQRTVDSVPDLRNSNVRKIKQGCDFSYFLEKKAEEACQDGMTAPSNEDLQRSQDAFAAMAKGDIDTAREALETAAREQDEKLAKVRRLQEELAVISDEQRAALENQRRLEAEWGARSSFRRFLDSSARTIAGDAGDSFVTSHLGGTTQQDLQAAIAFQDQWRQRMNERSEAYGAAMRDFANLQNQAIQMAERLEGLKSSTDAKDLKRKEIMQNIMKARAEQAEQQWETEGRPDCINKFKAKWDATAFFEPSMMEGEEDGNQEADED